MAGPFNLVSELHEEAAEIIAFPAGDNDVRDLGGFSEHLLSDCLLQLLRRDRIKLLRRVVHFVAAAGRSGLDPYLLTFGMRPTSATIREAFEATSTLAQQVCITDDGVTVEYADGTFTTPWAATPRLVCTLNLLAQYLDLGDFQDRVGRILSAQDSSASLDAIARGWADAVDRFRRERSGSTQATRQFQAIVEYLQARFAGGDFGAAQVSSAHVLEFWCAHAGRDDLDVRRYATAHECFADFVCALATQAAMRAAARASSMSATVAEGGTGDIAADDGFLPVAADRDDWLALAQEFPEIKFLTAADRRSVRQLAGLPVEAERLLVSALRAASLSETENRLVEYRRRRCDAADSDAVLAALQQDGPAYEATWEACRDVAAKFRGAVLAAAHVLIANLRDEGLTLLLEAEGSEDVMAAMGKLAEGEDVTTPADLGAIYARVFDAMSSQTGLPAPLDGALSSAERAWKQCNRAGFRRDQRSDATAIAALENAGTRLRGALAHIDARVAKAARQAGAHGGWVELARADTAIVHETLARLYSTPGTGTTPS